ncbi:S/N-oxide reductase, molybdopterin guanine dinucleotide-containing, partial [Pseudomonas savastanoi pv. glycinea]
MLLPACLTSRSMRRWTARRRLPAERLPCPGAFTMSFTSLHWGVYRPQVEEGKLKALLPGEWDKDPSPIGDSVADAITSPTRVMRPAIRRSFLQQAGGRPDLHGQEPFVKV